MSDLLLVVGTVDNDAELLQEVARARPRRVTVLLDDAPQDWPQDESETALAVRDRLANLLTAVEHLTGATVVGLAGARDQLLGSRFDRVVAGVAPIAA
jgi:hypothetical protein